MKKIVIMQPHFFPWFGFFELIKISDTFVHLDDVEFPTRSFVTRVKIEHNNRVDWIGFPIDRKTKKLINNTLLLEKEKNFKKLEQKIFESLGKNENFSKVKNILKNAPIEKFKTVSDLNIYFIETISSLIFDKKKFFIKSSSLDIKLKSSERILQICKALKATHYFTGHGSINYLNHHIFEKHNIKVKYLDYRIKKYHNKPRFYENLTVLDIVSHKGKDVENFFASRAISWRNFKKIKNISN